MNRPKTLASYIERLRRESVAACARPPSFDYQDFCRTYYEPGGSAGTAGGSNFTSVYRLAEILEMTVESGLPQMIDHHLGNAWHKLWQFAQNGYCILYNTKLERAQYVADLVVQFPEAIRSRTDAVFQGIRHEADPQGYYEQRFMDWEQDWYNSMRAAYAMTNSLPPRTKYKERLRLCRQAAQENFPALVELLEELREHVCDGGHTAAWLWGDRIRDM